MLQAVGSHDLPHASAQQVVMEVVKAVKAVLKVADTAVILAAKHAEMLAAVTEVLVYETCEEVVIVVV